MQSTSNCRYTDDFTESIRILLLFLVIKVVAYFISDLQIRQIDSGIGSALIFKTERVDCSPENRIYYTMQN